MGQLLYMKGGYSFAPPPAGPPAFVPPLLPLSLPPCRRRTLRLRVGRRGPWTGCRIGRGLLEYCCLRVALFSPTRASYRRECVCWRESACVCVLEREREYRCTRVCVCVRARARAHNILMYAFTMCSLCIVHNVVYVLFTM
jgi:hypothetical protein